MAQIELDGTVYRLNFVSRIKQNWLRRSGLCLLFIPLLILNWLLAIISMSIAVPWIVIRGAVINTKVLIDSTALRWNLYKED